MPIAAPSVPKCLKSPTGHQQTFSEDCGLIGNFGVKMVGNISTMANISSDSNDDAVVEMGGLLSPSDTDVMKQEDEASLLESGLVSSIATAQGESPSRLTPLVHPLIEQVSVSAPLVSPSRSSSSSSLLSASMDHGFEEDQVEHLVHRDDDQDDNHQLLVKNHESPVPIWNDLSSILLLILLYTIQGVPLGLTFGSVPFMLQSSSSYTDIGVFSFASYPYSLKLFWSPIVDSVYSSRMGRRKSWIVPIQLLVGFMLVALCKTIEEYVIGSSNSSHQHNIKVLTILFFIVVLLVATQDIAVDGWALTMLSKSNRGLASTCQSIGQNIGFFMSYTIFLALSSPSFCNNWLRSKPSSEGIVSLSSYVRFWGWVMIISTLLIWLLKTEKPAKSKKTLKSVYMAIWKIVKLPVMRSLLVILLTSKLAFSGADNVTILKLVEKGFPRETMALMVFVSFPFDILLPVLISRWVRKDGNAPLHAYLIAYPIRIVMTLIGAAFVYIFPTKIEDHTLGLYAIAFCIQVSYSFTSNAMFVALCTFFAEIADVKIGGTYMTLLNTVTNLGGTWPKFFVLYLVDWFTVKDCRDQGDVCVTVQDGYYTICILCATFGSFWWILMRSRINAVQDIDKSEWRIQTEKNE